MVAGAQHLLLPSLGLWLLKEAVLRWGIHLVPRLCLCATITRLGSSHSCTPKAGPAPHVAGPLTKLASSH